MSKETQSTLAGTTNSIFISLNRLFAAVGVSRLVPHRPINPSSPGPKSLCIVSWNDLIIAVWITTVRALENDSRRHSWKRQQRSGTSICRLYSWGSPHSLGFPLMIIQKPFLYLQSLRFCPRITAEVVEVQLVGPVERTAAGTGHTEHSMRRTGPVPLVLPGLLQHQLEHPPEHPLVVPVLLLVALAERSRQPKRPSDPAHPAGLPVARPVPAVLADRSTERSRQRTDWLPGGRIRNRMLPS